MTEIPTYHKGPRNFGTGYDMIDRIEELAAENNLLKTSGIIEVAVRNPNVSEYMRHWEGRAEAAEAKLAKAVEERDEALNQLDSARHSVDVLEKRVAELTGDKDE